MENLERIIRKVFSGIFSPNVLAWLNMSSMVIMYFTNNKLFVFIN